MGHLAYKLVLVAIGVGGVLLQIVSSGPLRDSNWGFHLHAFLPIAVGVTTWVLVVAAAWFLLRSRSPSGPWIERVERWEKKGLFASRRVVPLVAVTGAFFFWFFASEQMVLGDAWPLVRDLPQGQSFHPRQPLTMALQQIVFGVWNRFLASTTTDPTEVARQSVRFVSVVSGVLFVLVAYGIGRSLVAGSPSSSRRPTATGLSSVALLVCLVLLTQGYAQLFFGYLENYATYALSLGLYVLASLQYLKGRVALVVPLLLFVLNLGMHLSAIAVAPSVLFLCVFGFRPVGRRFATLRDVLVMGVGLVLLDRFLASRAQDYSLWGALVGIVRTGLRDQGGGSGVEYLLSWRHHRDFLNTQFLIGPLGGLLFLPAVVLSFWKRRIPNTRLWFLTVLAGSLWVSSWATAEPALGYARDWDLFAPAGVVFTTAGIAFLLDQVSGVGWRLRLLSFGILVSVLHLGSWVGVNHSEARSMRRFASLPLGLGRTEVAMGSWHLRHGRSDAAREWFEKALRVNPHSNTAHSFLGILYAEEGRLDEATEAYRRAVEVRPDQTTYRHNLIRAYELTSRWEETLPHYEMLSRAEPHDVKHVLGWARALGTLGRFEEARQVLERALVRFQAEQEQSPRDFKHNTDTGALLAALERPDEALPYFMRALEAEPESDNTHYNIGRMLVRLGRHQQARPYLQRLLQINPNHVRRDEVLGWLDTPETR